MEFFIFAIVAIIAVLAALGLLLSRNAIYAAMFLILNMVSLGVIYLLLNAPFIAAVQIAVYAGAIMVLFVFVIMLLGAEQTNTSEVRAEMKWQRPAAGVLALVLGAVSLYTLFSRVVPQPAVAVDASPLAIGKALFGTYLLPFEVASVLLLAAMVGAVVLVKKD
jgi:NADH-quinone oxidoreductase subunit J